MVWLSALLVLIFTVLWVYAFFDALTSPREEVRNLPKFLWLIVIILFAHLGALLWLFFGRPRASAIADPASVQTSSAEHLDPSDFSRPASRGNGPVGPDDDPEFLRRLDRRINPDE